MSRIINTEGKTPGSIYRIALENFVTYKQVELFPGPSLNVMIGPNGTGKSTFVCAIVLGLCGKTSDIGRAKKISEYVRSGCKHAVIQIELYQARGKPNVMITRSFDLDGHSSWKIDTKTVREKEVQDLISKLNIQVNNLCQLLPQDRVQDFAKMDPQKLLRSTLSAVGREQAVTQLDQLIDSRTQQRQLGTRLNNNSKLLEEQQRLNERLKVEIDAMEQRKVIEAEIEICEKKKLCIEYKELLEKVKTLKKDQKEAKALVRSHEERVQPLQKKIEGAKDNIRTLEQGQLTASREINEQKVAMRRILETSNKQNYQLKDLQDSFQDKVQQYQNREREVQEAKVKLEKLQNDKIKSAYDERQMQMEKANIQDAINKANSSIDVIKKSKFNEQHEIESNIVPQIRFHQNKINAMKNVAEMRLKVLSDRYTDCYKAVMWLRSNKEQMKFHAPVYEPMLLEINFTEPKFAAYLESTIPDRDLVAFTFESSEDMNRFQKKMREELKLKMVNTICSQQNNRHFEPPCNIAELRRYGFYTFLRDTVSAPDAILRYLCQSYNIHRIPIGDNYTYENSGSVPDKFTYFYTDKHRFTSKKSVYSGAKTSTVIEIGAARLLSNTVDQEEMAGHNNQLELLQQEEMIHREKIKVLEGKHKELDSLLNTLRAQKQNLNDRTESEKRIVLQIRMQMKTIQDLERDTTFDEAAERLQCRRKQAACVLKQCGLHAELASTLTSLQKKLLHSDLWKMSLQLSRDAIVDQASELRNLQEELSQVQRTLENIDLCVGQASTTAKKKLKEVQDSCNGLLPQHPQFPHAVEFAQLPGSLQELEEHCHELRTRIDCMANGDEQVLRDYEERQRTIQRLLNEVSNSSQTHKKLEDQMNRLKSSWLPMLEGLLEEINTGFAKLFADMGCAGEVKLEKAGSDEDYDKYGISILVCFRENETLQQLNRYTQSGGERALSTALYLMSLQTLIAVPFRCVDEINQGMDPINERKMFQLLVRATTQSNSSQYFLLTPKLLPDLEYNENITVHTIMNGKHIMNYKQWNIDSILQSARQLRHV